MPFSSACQTCKIRRIKCDETRPVCQRCTKSRRTCLDAEAVKQASFSIHVENTYASGKVKRPRGPRTSLSILTPSFDLQTRALSYYFQSHLQELSEVPRNSRGLAECVSAWKVSGRECSMVELALSSMALAIFARAQHHEPAAREASQRYCSVLKIAQDRIARLANSALDERDIDSCLLAVSLMSRYELATHRPGVYDSSMKSCSHYGGAMAILKVWNDKLHDKTPTFIIKQTRRELIKTAVVRNRKLPDWLLDGTRFGERDVELDYDRIVAKLGMLNYVFNSMKSRYSQPGEVEALDIEAREIGGALQDWAAHVPLTCAPQKHTITDPNLHAFPWNHLYSSTVYSYPKHGNAAAWCQYYAVRMLINSIRLGLLEMAQTLLTPSQYENHRLDYVTQIQAMADSIAGSIPFCLEKIEVDRSSSSNEAGVTISTNEDIKPHSASLLIWSLTIASRIKEINMEQKLWFKSELTLFGKVTGDGILEFAETHNGAISG